MGWNHQLDNQPGFSGMDWSSGNQVPKNPAKMSRIPDAFLGEMHRWAKMGNDEPIVLS